MTETARRELDEAAPPSFVNGDARHLHAPDRVPRRSAGSVRRATNKLRAERTEVEPTWPAPLLAVFRIQEAWRGGVAALAREQLDFLTASATGLVADGRSFAGEEDPARRVELGLTLGLAQLERSLDSASRLMILLGDTGGELLDAAGMAGRRSG